MSYQKTEIDKDNIQLSAQLHDLESQLTHANLRAAAASVATEELLYSAACSLVANCI